MDIEVDPALVDQLTSLISAFDDTLKSRTGSGTSSSRSGPSCSFSDLLDDINNSKELSKEEVASSIVRDPSKDELLREEFSQLIKSPKYESTLRFRQRLPAYKCKDDILKAISSNSVVVISGETGWCN